MEETPIRALIDSWPTRRAFAADVGAPLASVHKWAEADRIPARWQASVVAAAQSAGRDDVTSDWMLTIHARDRLSQEAAE